MKKIKLSLLALTCLALISLATAAVYQLNIGYGKQLTATTAPQQVAFTQYDDEVYAQSVSVINYGDSTVFCAVNCTRPVFTNMVNSGIAMPIRKNIRYNFVGAKFSSLWIQTTNGTADIDVAAY